MSISDSQREMMQNVLAGISGKTLRRGAAGVTVRALQLFLKEQGIDIKADGKFGRQTEKALREYQKRIGLGSDGVAGGKTFKSIRDTLGTPMPRLRPSPEPVSLEASGTLGSGAGASISGTVPLGEQPEAAPPEPVSLQATGTLGAGPETSMISGSVPGMPEPEQPPLRGQLYGENPMGDLLPQSLDQYSRATKHYWDALGETRYMDPKEFNSAHDKLVRALSGVGEANYMTGNSPLAGTDQYMPGAPVDFSMADPGIDPSQQGLADAMQGQGMVPSGAQQPQSQQYMALLRALMAN